jgi:hypothetical protein
VGKSLNSLETIVGLRPPPNRIPSAVQSDSVRRPIGFRTLSDDLTTAATQQTDRLTEEEVARIQSGTPLDWFEESNAICREIYVATPEGSDLSYDYIAKYAPVIERQLLRGGHRLAGLLNEIYG